jgi:cytochrome c553
LTWRAGSRAPTTLSTPAVTLAARIVPALLVATTVVLAGSLGCAPPAAAATVEERITVCLACHGAGGISRVPETPSLAGQPQFFTIAQLFLFRDGRRNSVAMTAAAKDLTNDDLRALADYVAKLPPPEPPVEPVDPARAARGRALARQHHCVVCHNPDFSGREQMPRLANQREDYLLKAMREYRSGARIGYAGAMAVELRDLSDADLDALAHYLSHFSLAR